MQVLDESSPVVARARELCRFLVDMPEFARVKDSVDAFMADEYAKALFVKMQEIGHELEHKQHHGAKLEEAEVARFEKARESALGNDLVRGFVDAQQQMHRIHSTVVAYVGKSLELGRVAEPSDFQQDECGPGCGCHH